MLLANYGTVVDPVYGSPTVNILPSADTEMVNLFLAQLAQDFADYFLVMQVDQAGWHRAKDLKVPENIRVIYQPPFSRSASIPSNMCERNCERNTCKIASFRLWIN